ncbi:MAG: helix-turn-helix transcriptional regulator [Erysipelotrichaceae bacterium]|nr:helix-turn-helix transcriptional regulator [Erysipelotrichaceae bacterium]
MTTGQKLKEIRLKRHKTLEDVAKAIDASPTTISKYESGKVTNIPQKKLEAIAAFLEVSPVYIMGYEDDDYDGPIVLNIEEQLMLEEYRQLSAANQETINMIVHRLLEVESDKGPKTIQLTL